MKINIIKKFSQTFASAPDMWDKLSAEYKSVEAKDKEMFEALLILGDTIRQFIETSEVAKKTDGISIQEALEIIQKRKKEKPDEDYGFLLYVMMKNLEHADLVKIYHKPERIVKKAMTAHGKKRNKK